MLSFKKYCLSEGMFTGSDITKRDGEYVDLVIKRIKEQKPFLFKDGQSEVILYDDGIIELENSDSHSKTLKGDGKKFIPYFNTPSGKKYKWNEIEKTLFSGKIDRLKKEKAATSSLNSQIAESMDNYGGPITIRIGRYSIENVMGASSDHIKGDPKADITLLDENNKDVGFISHKADAGAAAYQQYGGVSSRSSKNINSNKHIKKFARILEKEIRNKHGDNVARRGDSYYYFLPEDRESKELIGFSVYGKDWNGGKSFGRDSVHCIGQGDPILNMVEDGVYELTFSHTIHYPYDLRWSFIGEYKAILAARYMQARNFKTDDNFIKNIRPGVFPYEYMRKRRSEELKQ